MGIKIINKGNKIIVIIIAPNPPKAAKRTASFPLPWITILWPGNIDNTVPSSGTPKNIEGINSSNAWEIDIEIRKIQRTSGEYEFKR